MKVQRPANKKTVPKKYGNPGIRIPVFQTVFAVPRLSRIHAAAYTTAIRTLQTPPARNRLLYEPTAARIGATMRDDPNWPRISDTEERQVTYPIG